MAVLHIPRRVFLDEYWDYRPGEHVSLIEPTQQGKTHLLYQLLQAAIGRWPELRTVTAMPKPRDPATRRWSAALGFKTLDNWPPPGTFFSGPKPGYALWPKHLKDAPKPVNRAHLAEIFRRMLADQYWHGDSITVADDVYILAVILGLNMDCEEFWTAGGAGKAGLWAANQKPSGTAGGGSVSTFSYNSPVHLFLGRDDDLRNRQRFGEIGGVDPAYVAWLVTQLQRHQIARPDGPPVTISDKLYLDKRGNQNGPYMCIIGP